MVDAIGPAPRGRSHRLAARLLAPLVFAAPAAPQIVTENAGVISPELTILRAVGSVSRSENLDEVRWSHQLLWAPDRANELRLSLPLVWRTARFDSGGGELESHEHGLGDASLRYKRALFRADEVMGSDRWALLFEVGAPTGEHDAEEDGVPVPRPLQLGTGAWSYGAGSAYTWIRDRLRLSVEGFYRHRTRHDGVQLGDTVELNAAWWYRVNPVVFRPGAGPEVRAVLELLSSHTFPSEVDSTEQGDDGGIVWVAPGIHWYPSTNVLLEANVELPLFQDIDDALGERRWSANVVLKLLF
jgi:hypothetical protein